MFYGSIDLGGTNIRCALGDADGNLAAVDSAPTHSHEGPEAVLDRIAGLVDRLSRRSGIQATAFGMGVPGLVDSARGVTRFLPNLPTQWREVPVVRILEERLGVPVHILNDVRTATLGELTFGWGREVSSFIFLAIGTGIGGGVVIDGKLRLGVMGAAGEMGHQTILPDGPECGCGNRGCLEALANGPALSAAGVRLVRNGRAPILHSLIGGDLNLITPESMAQAAAAGEESVRVEIRRAADYIGIGIANVVTTLHPELVVLGGGVARIGDILLEGVRETLYRRVGMFPPETVRVEFSRMGDQAGILGGIALAMQATRPGPGSTSGPAH
ncbi:MAG: ROK family protein [Acidobacteriota bacterium]